MKAVILAGGFGTRLRPLTLGLPKPIVPIFDRPFLYYQTDLLRNIPEIDEVILSLNYRPDQIEARVGDGTDAGVPLRFVVEPEPLGTGGAIKYASANIDDTLLVFNGDVLTGIDLQAVVRRHRERQARATIVLTPVKDPSAYGLVETDDDDNVRRFLEKPSPDQITCNTINAGIYVLEPETFDRIPADTRWSIERQYFPTLVERDETFVAYIDPGYWLDIGTHDSYVRAHRDLMAQRCASGPFAGHPPGTVHRGEGCQVAEDATIEGPCFLGAGCVIGEGGPGRRRVGAGGRLHHRPRRDRRAVDSVARDACRQPRGGAGRDPRRAVPHRAPCGGGTGDHPWRPIDALRLQQDARSRGMIGFDPRVFKAYDVRGLYPDEINERLAELIGRGFVAHLGARRIAVSRDMRLSSPTLARAFIEGARTQGADVVDIGLMGTDQLYFAVGRDGHDGGAQITASHNPGRLQRYQARRASRDSTQRRCRDLGHSGHVACRRCAGAGRGQGRLCGDPGVRRIYRACPELH